ncbi:MAG: hypothetical protein JO296_04795 [Pseudonocardiales bacterium]|nr:hypothetical protein [Pseudonocardiales bacterium]MBV9649443.1 hypothetical protein [Pseudonocardiales bacterium]
MSTTEGTSEITPPISNNPTENLTYDVFVNDLPPQDNGFLPKGEPKLFSPQASTRIYGSEDGVLTAPGMMADQVRALGDRVANPEVPEPSRSDGPLGRWQRTLQGPRSPWGPEPSTVPRLVTSM